MVESAGGVREAQYQKLLTKAKEHFAKINDIAVHTELENGNIQVRQSSDENGEIISMVEAKVIDGLAPEDFKVFFDNFAPASVEINETCKRVDKCDEEEGHDVYKMEVNFPWPLWNRLMIITLYKRYD